MTPIRTAATELELPLTKVHKVLSKRLRLYAYKAQMLQRLQPNDKPKWKEFADNLLQQLSEDEELFEDEELLTASNADPVSINFLSHRRTKERDGGSFPYVVLHRRCVWTSGFVSINQDTHDAFSWGVTI